MHSAIFLSALLVSVTSAHSETGNSPNSPLKIMGGSRFNANLKNRNLFEHIQARDFEVGPVRERSPLVPRAQSCGAGVGSCPAGYCCSSDGWVRMTIGEIIVVLTEMLFKSLWSRNRLLRSARLPVWIWSSLRCKHSSTWSVNIRHCKTSTRECSVWHKNKWLYQTGRHSSHVWWWSIHLHEGPPWLARQVQRQSDFFYQ